MALAAYFLPLLFLAAGVGRWTRWPPILVALTIGLIPAVLGFIAMALFTTEFRARILFGGAGFLVGTAVAAFGLLIGRLRRHHLGNIEQ